MSDSIIVTHSGVEFDLLEPTADMIVLDDVAYALSHLVRFTGHCDPPITVAEHCVNCSNLQLGNSIIMRACFLHDLAEAYVNDLSSPLKKLLPGYKKIEDNILRVAFTKFGLFDEDYNIPAVHSIDRAMFAYEVVRVMKIRPAFSPALDDVTSCPIKIRCMGQKQAYQAYLDRAAELGLIH